MKTRNRALLAVMIAVALALPAIAYAATYVVRADGNSWVPAIRRIVKGDAVTWKNPTNRRHDVRGYGGNWNYHVILQAGERATKRFYKTGRFKYRCTYHSGMVDGVCQGMCGVVRVRAPA